MPYITSVEQIGYDRGVAEEAERTIERLLEAERTIERSLERERSLILRLLSRKVGIISDRTLTKINMLSITQLESLSEVLFDFNSIAELTNWLENQE